MSSLNTHFGIGAEGKSYIVNDEITKGLNIEK